MSGSNTFVGHYIASETHITLQTHQSKGSSWELAPQINWFLIILAVIEHCYIFKGFMAYILECNVIVIKSFDCHFFTGKSSKLPVLLNGSSLDH